MRVTGNNDGFRSSESDEDPAPLEKLWLNLDEDGEVSALIKRGRTTKPYDIGIPVCSLAAQIRQNPVFKENLRHSTSKQRVKE